MHDVLFFESFFFCSRDDLEHLQPLSQSLLNVIVSGSRVLPLRPIDRVDMGYDSDDEDSEDKIRVFVEKPAAGGAPAPDYEASILDGDFAETFRRLQNTCVKCFNVGIHDSPFLRYWTTQETASFAVVCFNTYLADDMDYGVMDSILNHLRPRTTPYIRVEKSSWGENGDSNENRQKTELLARDSFLNNLHICRLDIGDEAFPPPSFILDEPGYPNYELWCRKCQEAGGIDGLIESFIRDGCSNNKLTSVQILWLGREGQQPPAPKQLRKPTKVDMPLPKNGLIEWVLREGHEVPQCEMHSFVNAMQWKRMEVIKWTVAYDKGHGRRTALILQCRVENL